jgi:hypothetical protein
MRASLTNIQVYSKANALMQTIAGRAKSQSFVEMPEMPPNITKGGLVSRRIVAKYVWLFFLPSWEHTPSVFTITHVF